MSGLQSVWRYYASALRPGQHKKKGFLYTAMISSSLALTMSSIFLMESSVSF